jgi:hypothetical protein
VSSKVQMRVKVAVQSPGLVQWPNTAVPGEFKSPSERNKHENRLSGKEKPSKWFLKNESGRRLNKRDERIISESTSGCWRNTRTTPIT